MAVLKDYSSKPNCEVEINLKLVNDSSVKFCIYFRAGRDFPEVHKEIACLKEDFFKLLEDLKLLDSIHLSILEPKDPGLSIYHIPHYGNYFYPQHGFLQIPEHERIESETRYKLIFVLDANEKYHFGPRECGPAFCLIVKMEQILEFVESLKSEVNNIYSP